MRRFRALSVVLACGLAACSSAEEVGDTLGVEAANADAAPAPTPPVPPVPPPTGSAKAVSVAEETEDYSFEYSYPAPAAAIPALKARLDRELDDMRGDIAAQAKQGKADAEDSGYPFNMYGSSKEWEVVADLPRYLSLSAGFGGYTGGAHGYYGSGALVWDREANAGLLPVDMFTSPAALQSALGQRFCAALDRERAKKRGDEGDFGGFDECVAIEATTVLLGSSDKRNFDRIGLIADPYVAGPWAEGSYEVTLPVDKALIAAVKPQYREAFAVGR